MSQDLLLITLFGFGYFVTSIFATGGMVIAYAILGLFFDIKTVVSTNFYIAIFANILIILTDTKSIRLDIIRYLAKYSIPGLLLGIYFFLFSDVKFIMFSYAIVTTLAGLNGILNKKTHFHPLVCKISTFIGGFTHGSLVVGGPTYIIGLSNITHNKSIIRANITVMFLIGNIIRLLIMLKSGAMSFAGFTNNYQILISVVVGIIFGFQVHKKISQTFFNKALNFLILASGVFYLYKTLFF